MASRIDHTNCSHPRTPAGRAACRNLQAAANRDAAAGERPHRVGDGDNQALVKALVNMKRANAKVTVVTKVQDLPKPKLTPAQLASPIFQSLLRKREV